MERSSAIEAPLKHPGTGRFASVLRVGRLGAAKPVSIGAQKYVLVVASESAAIQFAEEQARAWVEAGAAYVCAWGPASSVVEETFDHASFLPELGEPLPFTLMTTSHEKEPLEEALWFAFYTATPPEDLPHELNTVVVVVDSAALEERCVSWVQENTE
jgi:hypothetical protein